jgi:hypothetical protein
MTERKSGLGFDLFETNLFRAAFIIFRRNWGSLGVAIALLLASEASTGLADAPIVFAVLRALILMAAAHTAYRFLASDGAASGWRATAAASGRFPWRFAGVMLIILSPILILGIAWNAPGGVQGPGGLGGVVFGVVMVVTYAALYILIGTALPAVAEKGRASLAEAFGRGRRNYVAIGRSLVFGVWLFRAGSVAVVIGLHLLGVTTDFWTPGGNEFHAAAVGPMLLFNASHVFAECLSAVVLTRAYHRFRGASPDTKRED